MSVTTGAAAAAALCIGAAASAGAVPQPGSLGSLESLGPGSLHFDTGTGADPVISSVAADPSVVRAPDGTFYLYATADDWMDGDGRHEMPIFSSQNLVDWTYEDDVFDAEPEWAQEAGGSLWAPDVQIVDGEYVAYYSVGNAVDPDTGEPNPCIGRAVSDSPTGPFEDHGEAVFCADDVGVPGTIDPDVVYEDGNNPVMFVGNFHGVYAVELNAEGTAPEGDPKSEDGKPVKVAGDGYEAPFVQKRDGQYYLYMSAGNCCNGAASDYRVDVGRSDHLLGPYTDSSGQPLTEGSGDQVLSGNLSWLGPGHNTVVSDDAGDDWIIYHAAPRSNPTLEGGPQNRQGMIDRITWTPDGWPQVGDGSPTSTAPAQPVIDGQEPQEDAGGAAGSSGPWEDAASNSLGG